MSHNSSPMIHSLPPAKMSDCSSNLQSDNHQKSSASLFMNDDNSGKALPTAVSTTTSTAAVLSRSPIWPKQGDPELNQLRRSRRSTRKITYYSPLDTRSSHRTKSSFGDAVAACAFLPRTTNDKNREGTRKTSITKNQEKSSKTAWVASSLSRMTSSAEDEPDEPLYRDEDVLCWSCPHHPGNEYFKQLLFDHVEEYKQSLVENSRYKVDIVTSIIDIIQDRGGRFLAKKARKTGALRLCEISALKQRRKVTDALGRIVREQNIRFNPSREICRQQDDIVQLTTTTKARKKGAPSGDAENTTITFCEDTMTTAFCVDGAAANRTPPNHPTRTSSPARKKRRTTSTKKRRTMTSKSRGAAKAGSTAGQVEMEFVHSTSAAITATSTGFTLSSSNSSCGGGSTSGMAVSRTQKNTQIHTMVVSGKSNMNTARVVPETSWHMSPNMDDGTLGFESMDLGQDDECAISPFHDTPSNCSKNGGPAASATVASLRSSSQVNLLDTFTTAPGNNESNNDHGGVVNMENVNSLADLLGDDLYSRSSCDWMSDDMVTTPSRVDHSSTSNSSNLLNTAFLAESPDFFSGTMLLSPILCQCTTPTLDGGNYRNKHNSGPHGTDNEDGTVDGGGGCARNNLIATTTMKTPATTWGSSSSSSPRRVSDVSGTSESATASVPLSSSASSNFMIGQCHVGGESGTNNGIYHQIVSSKVCGHLIQEGQKHQCHQDHQQPVVHSTTSAKFAPAAAAACRAQISLKDTVGTSTCAGSEEPCAKNLAPEFDRFPGVKATDHKQNTAAKTSNGDNVSTPGF